MCEGGEEGREIRGQKKVFAPSLAEYEAHMIPHVPFRKWCPFCVRGRQRISLMSVLQKAPEKYQ